MNPKIDKNEIIQDSGKKITQYWSDGQVDVDTADWNRSSLKCKNILFLAIMLINVKNAFFIQNIQNYMTTSFERLQHFWHRFKMTEENLQHCAFKVTL